MGRAPAGRRGGTSLSRRCTAPRSRARWRRRTPRSSSSAAAQSTRPRRSPQTRSRTHGRSRTRRCSVRPSSSRRSSTRPEAMTARPSATSRSSAHVTQHRPYFRAQNLTDAVRVACGAGDIDSGREPPRQCRHGRRVGSARCTHRSRNDRERARRHEAADCGVPRPPRGGRRSAAGFEYALALSGAGREAEATPILEELGVPLPPAQTAARTAK